MNIEILKKYKVVEGIYSYWINVKLLNEYRIIKWI